MTSDLPGAGSSRRPPPQVDPVELNGVRFEQARSGLPLDAPDPSGWMRATRIATGEELWLKQIYQRPPVEPKPMLPGGGKSVVYMRSITVSGTMLIVEDIKGRRFSVDPETGASSPIE